MNIIDVVIPMYNGQDTIIECINSIHDQQLSDNWEINTVIVDDASIDNSVALVNKQFSETIIAGKLIVIKNKINSGRAKTRNAGANQGSGSIICFLDCDCVFENHLVLHRYIELINSGHHCVFANIKSRLNNFEARYTNELANKRFESADTGNYLEMTSASFAITRRVYSESGGFCEDYTAYGFEDRDFIARLIRTDASITADKVCIVYHDDKINLSVISNKVIECAACSAPIYFKNFPNIYSESVYGKIDPRLSTSRLTLIYSMLVLTLPLLLIPFQSGIDNRFVPYGIKKFFVKTISFLSYIKGCLKQPVINNTIIS